MSELHVLTKTDAYQAALNELIPGRDVLELGVGTGALTKLILEAGAKSVVGYEILPDVCDLKNPRFTLVTADYTTELDYLAKPGWSGVEARRLVLVANPAYSTLPFIKEHVLPHIENAVIMVGEKQLQEFKELGFRILFWLTGDAFEPKAKGMHYVLARGLYETRFVDLPWEVLKIDGPTMYARVERLASILPGVGLCSLGGFPFYTDDAGSLMWVGVHVTHTNLRNFIKQGLGASGVLTYMNKSKLSLEKLGEICADRNHTWAYNWITATAVFAGHAPEVHLAFARDTRFKLGWVMEEHFTGKVFTATAPLKHWMKFTSKKDDKSYDKHTRQAMAEAQSMIEGILP
jgi:SAM-dependent methyltransferase